MELINFIKQNNIFDIKVVAHSSEDKIIFLENKIKVKIRAIAENGEANKSIVNLFSKTLKIPKNNIEIIFGFKNSNKALKITF